MRHVSLRYCILATGSKGNAVWVRARDTEVLLDCGLGVRALSRALEQVGSRLSNISAVICTHHHGDHATGAPALARLGVDVYASAPALERIRGHVPASRQRELSTKALATIGALRLRAIPTHHDAPGSIAVVVSDGVCALGMATDLGRKTQRLVRAFRNLDAVILESNHDVDMLVHGPYPERVKQRIRGDWGHLSNDQAADLLADIAHPGLRYITLVHLSEENNTPEHAVAAVAPALPHCASNATLTVAHREPMITPITLAGTGPLFATMR